jgi:ABC-type anion transport system duplicated permease subunit
MILTFCGDMTHLSKSVDKMQKYSLASICIGYEKNDISTKEVLWTISYCTISYCASYNAMIFLPFTLLFCISCTCSYFDEVYLIVCSSFHLGTYSSLH